MKKNINYDRNRERIIEFIVENPSTTYKKIKENIKLHPERFFNSIAEAFKEAGVKPPRTFERKTREENRRIIINYIIKHPGVGGHTLMKDTKINFSHYFKNIRDAYDKAGIRYTRREYKFSKKLKDKKRKEIIDLVRKNPYITYQEIESSLNVTIKVFFNDFNNVYKQAGISRIGKGEKRKNRKRNDVVNFILKNPKATQREVNKACETSVQHLFVNGIFEAYKNAGVEYPFERLKLCGTVLKEIRERARNFEEEIAIILSGYGNVNRLVKTKRGVADIILERKGKKVVVEVKDYQQKEISMSQVKQLQNYLEDCNCNLGILVCHKKPKRDKFLIGRNKIFILEKQELCKIPEII